MRIWIISLLLLLTLPVLAQNRQESGVVHGDGRLYSTTGGYERIQPEAPVGQVREAERRITDLKGPVKRASVKWGTEPVWVEEYDRQGRITCHIDYDSEGLRYKCLTYYSSPSGGRTDITVSPVYKWVRTYDAKGRLLSEVGQRREKGGKLVTHTRNSFKYNAAGYEVAWDRWQLHSDGDAQTSRGTRRLDSSGKLLHAEYEDGRGFHVSDYTYNAQGKVTTVRETDKAGKLLEETRYAYNTAGRLLKRETVNATGQRQRALILAYDNSGRLLTYEEYGWNYTVWSEKGVDHRSTPLEKRKGDAPLRLRTVHTYDHAGRITKTAHYNGDGTPCYQPIPTMSGSGCFPATFSYVLYEYDDKGNPHWIAYRVNGSEVRDWRFAPRKRIITPPPPPKVVYSYDRYGNWIKAESKDDLQVREISYY